MSSNTPTSPGNGDPVEDKNRPLDKVRHNSASVSESVNNQANESLDEDSESKSVDSEITFASATSAMPHQSSPMAAMTSRLSQGTVSRLTPAVLFPSAGATLVTRPVLFIHSLGGDSQPGRQVRNAHTLSYGDMVNIAYGLFVPAIKQDLAVHGTKSVAHILFPSLRHDSSQSDISMEILEVAMWYALGLARMSESGRHALRHSWDKVVDGKGPQAYWAVFWERASTLILAGNVARAASDITAGGLCVRTPMGIGAPALPNVENLTRLVATTNYERQKIVERLSDPNALICRISHLIVHPDHQRQGHGTLVLSKICEEMDTNKAYGIAIAPSNLVGWYRKFGFEAFGRLEHPFDNLQYVFRKPAEVGIIPVPDPNRSATGGSGIVGEAATRARDFALGLAHELIMPELVEVMDAHLKYAGQAYQTQDGEREEGVPTCVDIKTLCALAEVHTHQLGLVGDHAGRPESTDAHPERSEFTYGPIENGQAGDDGKPHYHIDKPREPGDHIERPEPVEACTEQPRSPGRLAEGPESANNHIERPKTAEGHIERPEPRRLRGYPPSKKLPKRKN